MTQAAITDFLAKYVTGKDAERIGKMIWDRYGASAETGQNNAIPAGGVVKQFNDAVYGADVRDSITKIALLIKGYLDAAREEIESNVNASDGLMESLKAIADGIYEIIGDYEPEQTPVWTKGSVNSSTGILTNVSNVARAVCTIGDPRGVKIEYVGDDTCSDEVFGGLPFYIRLSQYRAGDVGASTFIPNKETGKNNLMHSSVYHKVIELDPECATYIYTMGFSSELTLPRNTTDEEIEAFCAASFRAKVYRDKNTAILDRMDKAEDRAYGGLVKIDVPMKIGNVLAKQSGASAPGKISNSSGYYSIPAVPIDVAGHKYVHYTAATPGLDYPYGLAFYSEGLYDPDAVEGSEWAETPSNYFISGVVNNSNNKIGYEWRTVAVPAGAKWAMVNYWQTPTKQYSIPFAFYYADRYERSADYACRRSDGNTAGGGVSGWIAEEARRLGLHTIPESEGQLNAVRRCRQMTDIRWTPAVDLPRVDMVTRTPRYGGGYHSPWIRNCFLAGVEYRGMPYTKCKDTTDNEYEGGDYLFAAEEYGKNDFYVGFGVDFETFVTAVRNKNSMLCERGTELLEYGDNYPNVIVGNERYYIVDGVLVNKNGEEYSESYTIATENAGVTINEVYHNAMRGAANIAVHIGTIYGDVCSVVASHAFALSSPYTCTNLKGMTEIGGNTYGKIFTAVTPITVVDEEATWGTVDQWYNAETDTLEDRLKLGDLVMSDTHATLVTDIIKDRSGKIVGIEISEATPVGNGNEDVPGGHDGGVCRRKVWTPKAWIDNYGGSYYVLRYKGIDSVPYTPDPFAKLDGEPDMYRLTDLAVMPYEGSGFRYKKEWLGTHSVKFIISADGYNRLLIFQDGNSVPVYTGTIAADATCVSRDISSYDTGRYGVCLAHVSGDVEDRRTAVSWFEIVN